MTSRTLRTRAAALLLALPLALTACSGGDVDADAPNVEGGNLDVDAPTADVPDVDAPDVDAPDVDADVDVEEGGDADADANG